MKKSSVTYSKVFMYICVVLMLVLLATQFLPFWECSNCEDGVASISDYVWFPEHHKDITNGIMKDLYGKKFAVADVVLTPVVIVATFVLSLFFCIKNTHKPVYAIIPAIGGAFGVVGYLTSPGLQAGSNWVLHMAVAAVLLVCALVVLSEPVIKLAKKKAAEKQ